LASSRQKATRKLKSDFNLGGEQAEADPLLEAAFFEWAGYTAIESRDNPWRFLIGRTGSGKSAVLQRIEDVHPDHVIRINPEDLSLPYIVDLGVVRYLSDHDVHLDPLFIALWKHVLIVELIRHRYKVDSPAKKQTVLTTLMEAIRRDPSKEAALEYLDDFGGSFWQETDERVREITTQFENRVGKVAGVDIDAMGVAKGQLGIDTMDRLATEVKAEEADRFQRIVNETQLPRLNKMIAVLDEEVLASSQNFTYILIDDLDRDWVDDRVANDLIRCLFRAVLDLQRVRNLKIIVALRTNIFDQLNFGSRTGGQEEKFRSLQFRIQWTRGDLMDMVDERVKVAGQRAGLEVTSVAQILPPKSKLRGSPIDYILQRTLLRPRDLIAFLNECLRRAGGKGRLSWKDLSDAEATYSYNRLLALRDEWKTNFPGIQKVFESFRGAPLEMGQEEVTHYFDHIALLLAEPEFEGVRWLTDVTEPIWSGGVEPQEWADSYQPLVQLMYDIGFLGVGSAGAMNFSQEQPGFADAPQNLSAKARYVVHPAFHSTLGVRHHHATTGD
jgi:hypothetical protein